MFSLIFLLCCCWLPTATGLGISRNVSFIDTARIVSSYGENEERGRRGEEKGRKIDCLVINKLLGYR